MALCNNQRYYHTKNFRQWNKPKSRASVKHAPHRQRWIAALQHQDGTIPFASMFYRYKTSGTIRPNAKAVIQPFVFLSLQYGQRIYQVDSEPLCRLSGQITSFRYTSTPNIAVITLKVSKIWRVKPLALDLLLKSLKVRPKNLYHLKINVIETGLTLEFDYNTQNTRANDFKGCIRMFRNDKGSSPQHIPQSLEP